jgi:hypothetical protein
MSAKSWSHTIGPVAFDVAASDARRAGVGMRPNCCSGRGCEATPVATSTYRYVTGRGGRVTTAERHLCAAHAARFAARHGLSWGDDDMSRGRYV